MNQNYNFVRGLFSQESNAGNEGFAAKTSTSFKSLLLLVVFAFFANISMQGQTYFTESFEGAWYVNGNSSTSANAAGPNAPSGWTQTRVVNDVVSAGSLDSGAHDWAQSIFNSGYLSDTPPLLAQAPYGGSPGAAPAGTGVLWFFDGGTSTGNTRRMASPAINLSASTNPILTFSYSFAQNSTSLFVVGSLDGGVTWNTLATLSSTSNLFFAYTNTSIVLPSAYKIAGAKIGFQKASSWGSYDVFIDNLIVREGVAADAAPINFTATIVTFNATTIGWTDISTNETAFRLYRSTDNINFVQIGADIASTTSVGIGTTYSSVQALSSGTTYYYRIASVFELESAYLTGSQATVAGATYYWVGATGGLISSPANWNTMADGTGTIRSLSDTTDVLIVDGDGFVAGGTTTISVDAASFSIGQLIVNSNTALTLQSSGTTLRTITITGGPLDDFLVTAGSTLTLNHALNPVAFAFSGAGNTGNIAGTVNLLGSTSNVITTTGGTGTLVSVTSTGVVNMGNTAISLVGTAATLSFLNGSNCNVSGATTGAPPVPLASWETTSNLTISGITTSTTAATNKTQSYGNFIYNCPLATATMSFFTTANTAVIKGDLNIIATNTGKFRTLTSGILTVNGNLNIIGGTFEAASTSGTLNVLGNINVTGGTLDVTSGTGAAKLNLKGNFVQTGGALAMTGSSTTSIFQWNGTNAQTFTPATVTATNLNIQINNSLNVSLTANLPVRNVTITSGNLTGTGLLSYNSLASVLTYNGTTTAQSATFTEFPLSNRPLSLTINNTASAPNNSVVMSFDAALSGTSGVLTLTSGILDNSGYIFSVPNSSTSGVSGGSASAFVKGTLKRDLPVSFSTVANYSFPVGKGTYNPFVLVNPTTNAGGPVSVQTEVIDANSNGTAGTLMGTLNSNRYWTASITAGSANFIDTLIQLNDTPNGADAIASSATLGGAYSLIGGVTTTTTGTSLTSTAPKATTLPGYFVMGNKAAATLTNLVISPTGNVCANALRNITVTVTPGGGAVTGVELNYSINGNAQPAITMVNTSGNDWSGVIPTVVPSNGTVTWSVAATDANLIVKNADGTSYKDEPALGVTATATASLATVCAGSPTNLSMLLSRPAATLGTGLLLTGAITQPTAFCNRWGGYRSQTVYTAAELIASGMSAGSITSMAYNITTLGDSATNAGFTVKIGTTALSALTTTFEATTSFTTVYPSQIYTHTVSGQQVINFSTPYIWNGTSNIIIEVMHSGADATNNAITYYTTSTGNTVLTATSTTATTGTQSTQRLNLILQFNPNASAYSWSDGTTVVGTTNPLTVNPTATTVYTGTATIGGCPIVANTVTVTTLPLPTAPTGVNTTQCGSIVPLAAVTATSGASGTGTFNWYAAATGGVALQTSASTTYTTVVSLTTTFYVSEVGVNACESARTPVTITVLSPPVLTLSAAPQAICAGASTTTPVTILSDLSDYNLYTWSPLTDATGTTLTGFTFNPTTTTTYVLTGNNSVTTCATTANLVITVNPLPLITSATTSSEPLCIGSSTTLTAVSIPANAGIAAVGAGATTGSSYDAIFYHLYGGNKTQQLIRASELSAAGLVAGNITNLGIVINAGGGTYAGLAISLALSTNPDMAGGLNNVATFEPVYSNPSYITTTGTNTFNFAAPFVWDGFSSIIVQFCWSNNNGGGANSFAKVDATTFISTAYYRADNLTDSAICGGTVATGTNSSRPKFIFGGQVGSNLTSSATWTWSPATALSSTTGNVVTATPTVPTVYTVTAVFPTTCSASRTVSVTVLPIPTAPTATNATQCGTQLSTAHITSTTGLTNPIFVWYAGSTGGVALQTGAGTTFATEITTTTTLYVTEYNGSCESIRTPVVLTVTTPPVITITPTVASFCGTGGNTSLTATSVDAGMTYSWESLSPSATLSAITGANVTATISETSNFMVIGTAADVSCLPITSYVSIGVYALPTAVVVTDANGVCPGTSANISSGLSAGNFTVSSIPFTATDAPSVGSSSIMKNGVAIRPLSGGTLDDGGWSGIPIGFNFNYFGTNFSTISAGTNGVLMFGTPPGYGTAPGQLGYYGFSGPTYFPNTANPANIIALMATDMHMGTNTVDGSIKYWTEGYAPNRVFVIQYKNVNGWNSNPSATVQCRLYETIGVVEIHIFNKTFSNNAIVGLQDATQTIGAVAPGRAGGVWTVTTPEAWRFTPPANYNTTWTATTVNGSSTIASGTNIFNQTVAPAITTTYSISYTNQTTGCSNVAGSAQVIMTVLGNVAPIGINTIASATSICTGQIVNLSIDYTGITDGIIFQWQSFDGTLWSDIASENALTYSTIPTTATQYRCKMISCNGVPGFSSAASIVLANAIATTTPGTRCGTGTAILSATGNTGTFINWYANPSGGTALGTGANFTTPVITSDTSYYVASETFSAGSLPVGLGATLSLSTAQSFFPGGWGGAKTQYIIKASELLAAGIAAGSITSLGFEPTTSGQAYQGFSVSMASTSAAVLTTTFETAGLSQVYLGTQLNDGFTPVANAVNNLAFGTGAGSATSFNWDGSSNVLVSISWSSLPLASTSTSTTMKVDNVGFVASNYKQADNLSAADMLSYATATATGTFRPRFTINGQIICSSPRVAVLATVTSPPSIALSGNPATICAESSSTAVTIVAGISNYDTYVWSPAATVTGNVTTGWVFNPLTTTNYTLAVSQATGSSPCATTTGITVSVNPIPSVLTIAPTPATVCVDSVLPLVSSGGTLDNISLLNENFNGTSNTWTTVNSSTGGTPLVADWTLQPDGYFYSFYGTFHSNDNSQFYVSNSDAQGLGGSTDTELKSPVFSTLGFSNANLSFHHYIRTPNTATVEYSTNGGTTWTTIQTYTSTQGAIAGFVNENLVLPSAALNQAAIQIRFKYIDSYGYFWAIDNVSISGTQVATMSWSPITNLFTDPAATIAYAGGNSTSVYFKSSAVATATTYTANATSSLGCVRTASVGVTVNSLPIVTTLAPATVCSPSTVDLTDPGVTTGSDTGLIFTYFTDAAASIVYSTPSVAIAGTYYIKGTNANGCSAISSVLVTVNNVLPTVLTVSPAAVCSPNTIDLTASGVTSGSDAGLIFTYFTDAAATIAYATPSAAIMGTYFIKGTILNGCSTVASVIVTVNALPMVITVAQAVCLPSTVNLTASGVTSGSDTGLTFTYFTDAAATLVYSNSSTAVAGTYYIKGTNTNGCSAVASVVVTVNVTPAPTGAATQSLSSLLTVGDIVVVGSNVVWYASSADATSGSFPLSNATVLANTTYFATQTIAGCVSTTSLAVTITTLANQDFDMTQFSYYPNPVIDLLNVSYSQDMTNVKVFNMIGQQLLSKDVNATTTQIDMSSYAIGAYFIQVSTGNAMKTVRVIKK
jgi:hypothetical protein